LRLQTVELHANVLLQLCTQLLLAEKRLWLFDPSLSTPCESLAIEERILLTFLVLEALAVHLKRALTVPTFCKLVRAGDGDHKIVPRYI
jgi:hypothetical protein